MKKQTAGHIAKATALLIAIGGFLAAADYLKEKLAMFAPTPAEHAQPAVIPPKHAQTAAIAEPTPVIPPYTSDWVTGDMAGKLCKPRLAAYQAQYPNFDVAVTEPDGEHTSYHDPFKQDRYRYSCIFTVTRKSGNG